MKLTNKITEEWANHIGGEMKNHFYSDGGDIVPIHEEEMKEDLQHWLNLYYEERQKEEKNGRM